MAKNNGNGKAAVTQIKLQIPAGKASPAPPIGPALGQHGVNIMDFCKAYNAATKDKGDVVVPVEINVYADRTFDFTLKTPPTAVLIKKALKIKKGSPRPNVNIVGRLTQSQLAEIANIKMEDLNTSDLEQAKRIVAGSARSMGVKVKS